jgi:hypothetical protein
MSTWIVEKAHIDGLVQSLVVNGLVPFEQATETGKLLWQENVDAFNYAYDNRYPEDCPDVDSYVFEGIEAPFHPALVVRQGICWQYQCWEEDGCDQKPGWLLVSALMTKLSGQATDEAQYQWQEPIVESMNLDRPPWGITDLKELVAP